MNSAKMKRLCSVSGMTTKGCWKENLPQPIKSSVCVGDARARVSYNAGEFLDKVPYLAVSTEPQIRPGWSLTE